MSARLARAEWCALAFAVLVAHGFLVHVLLYPSAYDAAQYVQIGREIAANGLFGPFSSADMRTYGYPYLLSFVYRGAAAFGLPFQIAVFELQLLLYLVACWAFRNALMRISPAPGRIAFFGMMVNYYVLIYTPETLTESVSISLLVLAGGCWLAAARWGASLWPLFLGSLVVGFALMVRPANVFMVFAWLAGVVVIGIRQRPGTARAFVAVTCVAAALALPALPQLANNVVRFGKWTPLVTQDLGKAQQIWGIQHTKYATALPPVPVAPIYYDNPLYVGTTLDLESPWRWYLEYPGRGMANLALHTFNMTDQDLLFTYSRDLDPWYRLPLGTINHGIVALGLLGLFVAGRRVFAARERAARDAFLVLFALIGANLAVYAWTAVEMRFGSALLLVLFPFACQAGMRVAAKRNVRTIAATTVGVAGFVVVALSLSGWVREQAAPIRDAIAQHHSRADPDADTGRIARSAPRSKNCDVAARSRCRIPPPA